MKKRMILGLLAALICLTICAPALAAQTRQAGGSCSMTPNGKTVSFSGNSISGQNEDIISVTLRLMEYRSGTWYEVGRAYNSDEFTNYVSAAGKKTVTGGYYYKVIGTHYSIKNGVPYSGDSETSSVWISP